MGVWVDEWVNGQMDEGMIDVIWIEGMIEGGQVDE